MKNHGGKRDGAGRKPSPFLSNLVTVSFKDDAERAAFMALSPRERVAMALRVGDVMTASPTAEKGTHESRLHESKTDGGRDGVAGG